MKYYCSEERVALIVEENRRQVLVKSKFTPTNRNKTNYPYLPAVWVDKKKFKRYYKT